MVEKHTQETEELEQRLGEYEEERQRSDEIMAEANRRIMGLNDTVLDCKHNLQELGRKELMHHEMLRRMEGEIRRV